MTIQQWITTATAQLTKAGITSARLDVELLLAHTLGRTRTSLHAHPEAIITAAFLPVLAAQLQLRTERVPLAYLLGYKEFYGRTFTVTPATLVPRPESEAIITQLLTLEETSNQPKTLIDIGTGSGILGITSQLELPHITVTLSDISPAALEVATHNAAQLGAHVTIAPAAHLLSQQTKPYDYIIANLPYVAAEWDDVSPELQHEPQTALYADNHGLALIYELLPQAASLLTPNGYLLLEADPTQHGAIIARAHQVSLATHQQQDYCLVLTRA
ncbi:MAG: peptide chain release factor N(5)-glutamine methyltransferase [Candidatus Saccharibacteria bacterium]|nr:peptide chain release factor N(5)-glutamine methyltransferase [Candidatus Saccharibacteria bacterium]